MGQTFRASAFGLYALALFGCGASSRAPEERPAAPLRIAPAPEEADLRQGPSLDHEPEVRVLIARGPDVAAAFDGEAFPGRLERTSGEDGEPLAVLHVPMETYLRGVVSAELPASWGEEVKRAQAIAARSYASVHLGTEGPFDLESNTMDQVYRARENATAVAAVEATRGQVLVAHGEVAEGYYHSTCGGHTEDPAQVWPDATTRPWATACTTCAASPRYAWTLRLGALAVGRAHPDVERVDTLAVVARMPSGRAQTVTLTDDETSVTMDAPAFRRAIGTGRMRSALFEHTRERGAFVLTGRGFGHGVGMCQWGAHGMAEAGADHLSILAHYYGGTTVRQLYP